MVAVVRGTPNYSIILADGSGHQSLAVVALSGAYYGPAPFSGKGSIQNSDDFVALAVQPACAHQGFVVSEALNSVYGYDTLGSRVALYDRTRKQWH